MTSKVTDLNIGKTSFLYLRFGWELRRLTDCLDGLKEIGAATPERIDEDQRHTGCHRDHAPNRIDQSGRRGRYANAVEHECEDDVVEHLSVTVAADLVGREYGADPLVKDDHVGGFDCDVRSAAESNADIGLH